MEKELRTVKINIDRENWNIFVGICKSGGYSAQEVLGKIVLIFNEENSGVKGVK